MMNCSVKRPLSFLLRSSRGSLAAGLPRYVNTVPLFRKTVSFSENPIPPLPALDSPSSGSVPSTEDLQQYAAPLYQRGWKIRTRKIPQANGDDVQIYRGKTIERKFEFKDTPTAFEFFEELASISSEQKHLPSRLALTSNNVDYQTTSLDAVHGDEGTRVCFTRQDLRVAILAETCYAEKYVSADRAPSTVSIPTKLRSGYPLTEKVLVASLPPSEPKTLKIPTMSPPPSTIPLPPSPEVSSPPSPLVDEDFETYLGPLSSRGWAFNVIQHPRKKFASILPEKEYSATYLLRVFAFETREIAFDFAKAAGVMAIKETEDVIVDVNTDLVYVQTTTRLGESASSRYSVTHRDISLAIRFEELAAEKGALNRTSTTMSVNRPPAFPKTVAELETFEMERFTRAREFAVKLQKEIEQKKTMQREAVRMANAAPKAEAEKAKVAEEVKAAADATVSVEAHA